MAQEKPARRRPRIRKSAPTVRERVEAAKVKDETPKPKRIRGSIARRSAPLKKLSIGSRRPVRIAKKPLGFAARGLKWLVPRYFINSWRELRQVHWPNRKETWRLTLAVFVFAVVFGALVAGVDKSLDEIFKKVVLK